MILPLLAAAAAACAPAIELAGDPEPVARLLPSLVARGLASPRPGCPVTRVEVTEIEGGVRVEARDALGRVQVRELEDEAAAPAVIEGLLRTGLTVTIAPPPAVVSPRVDVPVRAALAAEAGVDGSGSLSTGLRASIERPLGAASALLRLRWAFTPDVRTSLPQAHRHELELGVGLRRAFRLGGLEVAPGLALAGAAVWTARSDPACGEVCGVPVARDGASAIAVGPRAGAFVEITRALGAGVAGDALVEVAAAPFSAGPRVPAWARALPDREARGLALPGDPAVLVRVGFGVSWGRR